MGDPWEAVAWEKFIPAAIVCREIAGYDLGRAMEVCNKMRELGYDGLSQLLCRAGNVCTLYYPGIGIPPARPGGDITFATRAEFIKLLDLVFEASQGRGNEVVLTGAQGIGKSCYLRALVWLLVLAKLRVICLWSMEAAYEDLVAELVSALHFAYCCDGGDVHAEIDAIRSPAEVEAFMKKRPDESFYIIIDGAEVVDKGKARPERMAVDAALRKLVREAHVTVRGLSPMADQSRKRKASSWSSMTVNQGFFGDELIAYAKKASVLGSTTLWIDDIRYFAGSHPMSLSLLDASCKRRARTRNLEGGVPRFDVDPQLKDQKIASLLKDKGEWNEVLKLFLSSAEMTAVRSLLNETLDGLDMTEGYFREKDMMEKDMRFVVGDPLTGEMRYVTPYIKRIYLEGFRDAESRKIYKGAAWFHYCRHLIDSGTPVNWSEMGWMCENLVAEVINFKGLVVNNMIIRNVHTQRFGTVPNFSGWFDRVATRGSGVYFLPLKYNYRSIDGLVVWRDSTGQLHLVAIQVTVNPEKHGKSADEFMSFNTVTKWIPKAELPNWKLHFVFLCLKDAVVENVEEKLETKTRSQITYGTVAYQRHSMSFATALAGIAAPLRKTLEQVAQLRYDASEPAADRDVIAEQKAIADAFSAADSTKASPAAVDAIRNILSRGEFSKLQLEKLAGKHHIHIIDSDTKPQLIFKIASGIAEL